MRSFVRSSARKRRLRRRSPKEASTRSYSEHLAHRRAQESTSAESTMHTTPSSEDSFDAHQNVISLDPATLMHGLAAGGLDTLRGDRSVSVLTWLEVLWLWGGIALVFGLLPFLLLYLLCSFLWTVGDPQMYAIGAVILMPFVLHFAWGASRKMMRKKLLGSWESRAKRVDFQHAREDLILQCIARNDLRFSTGLDGDIDVMWSPHGWTMLCPLTRAQSPAEMTLRAKRTGRWEARIRVVARSHENIWQSMEWPEGVSPSIRSTERGSVLEITLRDEEDLRRRFLNTSDASERDALRHQIDQQSDAWAQVWTNAIRPLLSLEVSSVEGISASRWGMLPAQSHAEEWDGIHTTETRDTSLHMYWDSGLALAHLLSNRSDRLGSRISRGVVWGLTGVFVALLVVGMSSFGAEFWPSWWVIFLTLLALSFNAQSKKRTSSTLPAEVREPRFWQSHGLTLHDGVLSIGRDMVDLSKPFGCTWTRTQADHKGQSCLNVEVHGMYGEKRGRVLFRVPIQYAAVLEDLPRLESTAPLVSGDDFDAWVWPALSSYASFHGTILRQPVVRKEFDGTGEDPDEVAVYEEVAVHQTRKER